MLEIHPLKDEAERAQYIAQYQLPGNTAVLRAYEDGEVMGNISLSIDGLAEEAVATLHTFEYQDDFTGELLVRAAISYAFNRAVPAVKAPVRMKDAILEKVGFKTDEQNISISTKNVVHLCK